MADKTFTVTYAHARAPIVIHGKNLKEAIESEGLDPNLWHEVTPQPEAGADEHGED